MRVTPDELISACCELTERITQEKIYQMGGMLVDRDNCVSYYSDAAQVYFDDEYDQVEEILIRTLNIERDGV